MHHKLDSRLLGRNISNPRHADDSILIAESIEKLKSLLKVKEESDKADLIFYFQKTKIMASSPISSVQFSSVTQSCPTLCDPMNRSTPGFLFITNFWSSLKLTSIESVMPSNHLILCQPLLLLPSIFPTIKVLSNMLALRIRWPKYWSFNFSISPSNEYFVLISSMFISSQNEHVN